MLRVHFAAVDQALLPLFEASETLAMNPTQWAQVPVTSSNPDSYRHYAAHLRRPNVKHARALYSVSCNVWYGANSRHKQLTPIAPSLIIQKPAHDLQLEWHVRTQNKILDQKIQDIIIKQAKKF